MIEHRQLRRSLTVDRQQAEVAAVWHEPDAKKPDQMQAGRFNISAEGKPKPATAAPGLEQREEPIRPAVLEKTEAHDEMAKPENQIPAPEPPKPPSLTPEDQRPEKKPEAKPAAAPATAVVPARQP